MQLTDDGAVSNFNELHVNVIHTVCIDNTGTMEVKRDQMHALHVR